MAKNRLISPFATSLYRTYPKKWEIPAGLFLAIIFLGFGLFLPVITLKELVLWKSTFSVWTGIVNLVFEGHYFLAIIIFLFSIIFPITKLTTLITLWFGELQDSKRKLILHWMGIFGKWSMLDVFVVAIMIVITKISKFASADPRIGIYFFGASVLITLIITERIEYLLKEHPVDQTLV